MSTDAPLTPLMDIFLPYATSRIRRVQSAGTRFVHYTTADAAIKIIRSQEVWMRSSSCMVDFQEIEYGLKCLTTVYESELGGRLRSTMDGMFPGFSDNFAKQFAAWVPHFREQTYFTCISEHDADEDEIGRLSMWRAFGKAIGVALVFNNKPFLSTSNALSVYSTPVAYFSAVRFDEEFEKLVANIEANVKLLRAQSEETVLAHLFHAFRFAVLSTKHPGFSEEREWRIVYAPTFEPSKRVTKAVEVIGGVPQTIFKIPLHDVPDEGLRGVSVPTLLDRIIIGPTQYPGAVSLAFEQVLSEAGVDNSANKIWVSDIPLRSAP